MGANAILMFYDDDMFLASHTVDHKKNRKHLDHREIERMNNSLT